jgi:hypothetical protein
MAIPADPDGLVIDPKQIPEGATMVLAASDTNGKVALAGAMTNGSAPTCLSLPNAKALRTLPGSGKNSELGSSNVTGDSGGHMTSGSAPPSH